MIHGWLVVRGYLLQVGMEAFASAFAKEKRSALGNHPACPIRAYRHRVPLMLIRKTGEASHSEAEETDDLRRSVGVRFSRREERDC
jgi:hypothetical protein